MSKQSDKILNDVRKYFDDKVLHLSPSDYKQVLDGMLSTLESYDDCLRDEQQGEEDNV